MVPARVVGGLVLLAVLAATHWFAWDAGRSVARAACVEENERVSRDAADRVRQIEKERFRAAEIAASNHQSELEKSRVAARAARGELSRLRDELAARERAAGRNPDAAGAADGPASEGTLLGECAARYSRLAAQADNLADRLRGLQEYVAGVFAGEQ